MIHNRVGSGPKGGALWQQPTWLLNGWTRIPPQPPEVGMESCDNALLSPPMHLAGGDRMLAERRRKEMVYPKVLPSIHEHL